MARLAHREEAEGVRSVEQGACSRRGGGCPAGVAPPEQLRWGLPKLPYLVLHCLQHRAWQLSQVHIAEQRACSSRFISTSNVCY